MHEPLTLNPYCSSNNYDVIKNQYDILRDLILAECDIPEKFFAVENETEKNFYFLIENETFRFLFNDYNYESIPSLLPKEPQPGGLYFWFSKVHPDDRRMLGDRIVESLKI